MTIKGKDFQKAAAFFKEFLLKISDDNECADLRDTLNLALLHMQKYYRVLQQRSQDTRQSSQLTCSSRGLSPMTPFKDTPDKFQWRWVNIDSNRTVTGSLPVEGDKLRTLPLIIQAAKEGDHTLINTLVSKDADCLHDVDCVGRTALIYALHYNRLQSVRVLLQNNADVNTVAHDGTTACHHACHDGNQEGLALLIQHGAELAVKDAQGRAPVHWACTTHNTGCLMLLVAQNVDVCVRDKDGLSPNMWACRLDHIDHFQLLCQSQDIEDGMEQDNQGRTWVHWAVRKTEPLECLQTLLTKETSELQDEEGKTVFLAAAEQGSVAASKAILDIVGYDCLNDADMAERTCLHLATEGGHGELVNYLVECGADMTRKDKYNANPMDYAKARQLHYCQLILSAHERQLGRKKPEHSHGDPEISQSPEDKQAFHKTSPPMPHPPSTCKTPQRPPSPLSPHPPVSPLPRVTSAPVVREMSVPDSRHVSSAGHQRTQAQKDADDTSRVGTEGEDPQMAAEDSLRQMHEESPDTRSPSPAGDSLGGMDVSDIDEEDRKALPPHPSPQQTTLDKLEYKPNQPQQFPGNSPLEQPIPPPRSDRLLSPKAPIGQLRPLGHSSQDQGAKTPKKKKKKDKKSKADLSPVSMPPVKGYAAPMQAPPLRGPPPSYLIAANQNNGFDDRNAPEDPWGSDPPRPSAPVPPYTPRDAHGRGPPAEANSHSGNLQRMESEEDLCVMEDVNPVDRHMAGPYSYPSAPGLYSGPNDNGPLPRDKARSLMGHMAPKQGSGLNNTGESGMTALHRPKTPMNGKPYTMGTKGPPPRSGNSNHRLLPNAGQSQRLGLQPLGGGGPHPPIGKGTTGTR